MKKIFLLTCVTSILYISCTKHSGDMEAPAPAITVTVAAPVEGAVYQKSDSLFIQGIAIGKNILHGYDLKIRKAADTAILFSKHIHDHNDTLVFSHKWKGNLSTPVDLEAELTFALDHDGDKHTKKVRFSVR